MLFSKQTQADEKKQLKIIDFGMAALFSVNQQYKGLAGTPYFLAPEILKGWYNHKCDVWSLGITAFCLLTGKNPFTAKTN